MIEDFVQKGYTVTWKLKLTSSNSINNETAVKIRLKIEKFAQEMFPILNGETIEETVTIPVFAEWMWEQENDCMEEL